MNRSVAILIGASAIFIASVPASACKVEPPESRMRQAALVIDGSAEIINRTGRLSIRKVVRGRQTGPVTVQFPLLCEAMLAPEVLRDIRRRDAVRQLYTGRFYLSPDPSQRSTYIVQHFVADRPES